MNKYESVIIMKPDVDAEIRNKIVAAIRELVDNSLEVEDLGVKTLAYEIKENKQGYYLLFNLKCNADKIDELEKYYRLEDNIIKFIVVRTDEED